MCYLHYIALPAINQPKIACTNVKGCVENLNNDELQFADQQNKLRKVKFIWESLHFVLVNEFYFKGREIESN